MKVKVAVVQKPPVLLNRAATIVRLIENLNKATARRAGRFFSQPRRGALDTQTGLLGLRTS